MLAALITPLAAAAQTPLPDPYDYDEATPAPKPAKPARWQTVELGKPGHRYKIPVYANRPLGKGELADIKQVVVVIHGVKRDADRYYEYVTDLLERNPERARDTLVLAPRFSGSIDSGFAGMAAWRKASWEEGEDSVQAAGRPAPVSSFRFWMTCCAAWTTASACPRWPASCWPAIPAARSWCNATPC